jgi:hypothetical protein
MTQDRKEALYESGRRAAEDFFLKWDFADYKAQIKEGKEAHRSERVWQQT